MNIKQDFPIFDNYSLTYSNTLTYLDTAATSQKPKVVIDAVSNYYLNNNSNVHRGVYRLASNATLAYEKTRVVVKDFINASDSREIIFTKGATEAFNLLAFCITNTFLVSGDEIIISHMEHHANIVPWQIATSQKGIKLKVLPINEKGQLEIDKLDDLITPNTKVISIAHVSNVLGTVNPIKKIVDIAKSKNHRILTVVDGAQAVGHIKVDVDLLGCDFYTFSSHKMYGPTGLGVLYGKQELLESFPPYQGGGEMIKKVTFEETTFNHLPYKLEAGTPPISAVIAFSKAIEYILNIGLDWIENHEKNITKLALYEISKLKNIKVLFRGDEDNHLGIISFIHKKIHAHDLASILDLAHVNVRAGHHCAMPLMSRMEVQATSRLSIGVYTQKEDINRFVEAIKSSENVF